MFSSSPSPRRTAIGLSLLFLIVLAAFASFSMARAADGEEPAEEIAAGTLMLLPRGGGAPLPAVRLGTHYEVRVSGRIARTRVVQAFRNGGQQWAAATYLYPLPGEGAVDSLKMVVGQRVIVGEIRRRAEASEIYERAKAAGQKAALVEQQRPNMFTTRVANIAPGETVLIEIEYQAPVMVRGGAYSLRLPLVVGPRYVPPRTVTSADTVAHAQAVTAPLRAPRDGPPLNPVSIEVHLQPGFPIANLDSPYHPIRAEQGPNGGRIVRLADGEVPANRDFELSWRSVAADATVGLFRERVGDRDYLMAMRPRGARLTEEELPLDLPHGWNFDALFGGDVPGSQSGAETSEQIAALELPQTGTDAAMLMRNGALLLLLALAGLAALRRRKPACA